MLIRGDVFWAQDRSACLVLSSDLITAVYQDAGFLQLGLRAVVDSLACPCPLHDRQALLPLDCLVL